MLKYIVLAALAVGCSQKSNTQQMISNTSTKLDSASNYHDYMDEVVAPAKEDLEKQYAKNPTEVCETFAKTKTEDLLKFNDVLEEVKEKIPCARDGIDRINNYYEDYKKLNVPSKPQANSSIQGGGFSLRGLKPRNGLETSPMILEKEYSLPGAKQLPPKVLNLTFDDGPHAVNTQKVLGTLKDYGVVANFFVLGKNARAYPQLIKAEASAGHSVGGHSMTHANLPTIGFNRATAEIIGVFDVIESILGGADPFFRFPYGSRTQALRNFVAQNNISDFFWNVDTLDWKYKNPDFLLDYALRQTTNTGRGIVLFHDIQPQTAAILPAYLNGLSALGYSTIVYEPK